MSRLKWIAAVCCLLLNTSYAADNNTCYVAKIQSKGQDEINKNLVVKETGSESLLKFNVNFPIVTTLMAGEAWPLPDNINLFPRDLTSTQGWKNTFNAKFPGNEDFIPGDILVKFHAKPESVDNDTYAINFDVKYYLMTRGTVGAEVVVKENVKIIYQPKTRTLLSVDGRMRDQRGWFQNYSLKPCANQAS
jgi:hypothetical protein